MTSVLVVAPHPDDETLGCGGALHRHRSNGDAIHWLIVTDMTEAYTDERRSAREVEIAAVAELYGFASVHRLGLPTSRLDELPLSDIIAKAGRAFENVAPEVVYLPFRDDAHSDHRIAFDATAACCKAFRSPGLREVYCYEVPSETGFGLAPGTLAFRPTHFVDIADQLEDKLRAMRCYADEMAEFPFPRSETVIRALAALRGSECGRAAAEAFIVIRQVR